MATRTARWTAALACAVAVFALLLASAAHMEEYTQRDLDAQLLDSAESHLRMLESFRTLYTSEVVARVPDTVKVTHDYEQSEHAIPLPATLSIRLADHIGEMGSGLEAQLFSRHPFPWRAGGRRLGAFETAALDALDRRPHAAYHSFEDIDGVRHLRYARADLMRVSCVKCHNNHPQSPKKDWQVGDVRGALTVAIPARAADSGLAPALRSLLPVHVVVALVLVVLMLLVLRKDGRREEPRG